MGLAPPGAREEDFICAVHGITRALVVRKPIEEHHYMEEGREYNYLEFIDTAVMADNLSRIQKFKDEGLSQHV
jgi:hypothetical protein